ncbi:hypothetical protein IQ07DRAFT_650973 [Pyrenochaeta sp. DS3sAY3a]|nr:hypothetical protein IQ07DRAFT_650973 [Pyrenochaeta sp. DS3sAY3a]
MASQTAPRLDVPASSVETVRSELPATAAQEAGAQPALPTEGPTTTTPATPEGTATPETPRTLRAYCSNTLRSLRSRSVRRRSRIDSHQGPDNTPASDAATPAEAPKPHRYSSRTLNSLRSLRHRFSSTQRAAPTPAPVAPDTNICTHCKAAGHWSKDCPVSCAYCGRVGHEVRKCRPDCLSCHGAGQIHRGRGDTRLPSLLALESAVEGIQRAAEQLRHDLCDGELLVQAGIAPSVGAEAGSSEGSEGLADPVEASGSGERRAPEVSRGSCAVEPLAAKAVSTTVELANEPDSRIETVREIMADLEFMNSWIEKIREDIQKLRL